MGPLIPIALGIAGLLGLYACPPANTCPTDAGESARKQCEEAEKAKRAAEALRRLEDGSKNRRPAW